MAKNLLTIRKVFKSYSKESENPVDIKVYTRITGLYNKFLSEKILQGEEVTLPCRMGTIKIVGKKRNMVPDEDGNLRLPIDWGETNKYWKSSPEAAKLGTKIYHLDEIGYRFVWSRKNVMLRFKNLYSLKMTRGNKRSVKPRVRKGQFYPIIK